MLELNEISRRFGDRLVLDELSFTVRPGRMTGFVGPNGSGKTTTMRIILGVLAADSGTVSWQDGPILQASRQRFGYMPEERGLYPKMKVADQISYLGRLHGLSIAAAKASTATLLEQLGLAERAGDTVESLSLGNQQRAQIAAALVHDPTVLILDEPFSGLDPMAVDVVLGVLRQRAALGAAVLFSSHQLDLVEQLCDDIVIISGGRVKAAGDAREVRQQHSKLRYRLVVDGDAGWMRDLDQTQIIDLDINGSSVVIELADARQDQWLLAEALLRGPVRRFEPVVPTLAEIFREVVK